MAISNYTQNGKTLWMVYLNIRSKVDPTIRLQKRVGDLDSQAAAQSEEKRLLKQLSRELATKEGLGFTWAAIVERWELAMRDPNSFEAYSPQTVMDHVALLHKWTFPWLKKPAREITSTDVREVVRELRLAATSYSYQVRVKGTINVVFTFGIAERLIRGVERSPTFGVDIPKVKNETPPEIYNVEQIKKLLTLAKRTGNLWYPIYAMALLTGMRSGELFALEWLDVDLDTRKITVSKSFNKRLRVTKCTKAGYWRTVPISDELCKLLSELKLQSGGQKHVLPRLPLWTKGLQAQALRGFCSSVGLPSIKFHTLRACFATQLLRNNIAPAVVMKICGWKDFKTMMRYLRLAGIEEAGATDCLKILPDEQLMATVSRLFTDN